MQLLVCVGELDEFPNRSFYQRGGGPALTTDLIANAYSR